MTNKTPPGMIIYDALFPVFHAMPPELVGRLVVGMCDYFSTGVEPDLPTEVAYVWPMIRDQIDRNVVAYNKKTAENDLKGAYSQYVRKTIANGETPIPYASYKNDLAGCVDERNASDRQRDASDRLYDASVDQLIKTKQNITETITNPIEMKTKPVASVMPDMPPTLADVQAYCDENQLPVSAEAFVCHYEATGWKIGNTPITDWRPAVRKWALNQQSQASSSPTRAENNDDRPTREELERLKRLRDKIRGEGAEEKSPSS